jgi:hypothetical protein
MLHLLDRDRDRDEQDDVPGMADRQQSERRSEPTSPALATSRGSKVS